MAESIFLPSADYGVEQLIDDLVKIAGIPEKTLESFVGKLHHLKGLPGDNLLIQLLIEEFGDTDSGAAVVSILGNVHPQQLDDVLEAVDQLRQSQSETTIALSDEIYSTVKAKLRLLIHEYPAITRYKKAFYLSQLTGCSAESVDIICDIRPLFSEDRTEILGLIPHTAIRLGYKSQDRTDHVIEFNVTKELLQAVVEKIELAQRKLDTIHASGNSWIPYGVPDIS